MMNRIMNAIESRRYLFLNSRRKSIPANTAFISFTFDDFPESAAIVGTQLLEEHDWRGTFYLASESVGKDSAVGKISSFAAAQQIQMKGHEIGNHTHTHFRCLGARKEDLRRDMENSFAALAHLSGVRNFSLPFGVYDASALNVLSGHFDTIRTITPGINRGMVDFNLLKANRVYHTTDMLELKAKIQDVSANGGWLIFYTHDISAEPSDYGCTEIQFKLLLSWIAQCQVEVLTVKQVVERIK
jgi:peptidoglycan/xylan/chitin deacetylase (PgdA/CDA1 family)